MCKIFYSIRKSIFTIFSFFICHFSFSQQPAHFFLGEDVFSGVQIYDVIQDNDNNYWFATDHGFYMYDGYDFKKIQAENLKGESAFGFIKSKDGILYCHNLNGQVIRIKNKKCDIFYELLNEERGRDFALSVLDNGNVLIFSKETISISPKGEKKIFPGVNYVYSGILKLRNGQVIAHCSGKNEVVLFSEKGEEKLAFSLDELNNKGVMNFMQTDETVLAIHGATKIIYEVDIKSKKFIHKGKIEGINSNEFYRFYRVKNQTWLAGANLGVTRLKKDNSLDDFYFKDYLISNIFEDHEGNILFSTFNHGVIVVPDLNIKDVIDFNGKKSIISIGLLDDKLIVGTLEGDLGIIDNGTYKTISDKGNKPIEHLITWQGFPYVIFDDGEIKLYNINKDKIQQVNFDRPLKDAALINKDSIVYGTNGHLALLKGVYSGNLSAGPFEKFGKRIYNLSYLKTENEIYIASMDGLMVSMGEEFEFVKSNGKVIFANDVCAYKDEMFVSASDSKMYVFKNNKIVKSYIINVNRSATQIVSMKIVDEKIYAITSNGFVVFNLNGEVLYQLNRMYGFNTNNIFDFAVGKKEIWIAHARGVEKFDLANLSTKIDKPTIKMNSIWVNDSLPVQMTNDVSFDYTYRRFQFEFSSASIRNRENIIYHYKLEGYDKEWNRLPYEDHSVVYNGLEPGSYTFSVKAENQGVYSNTVKYSFTILAPFYKRWWFFVLIGLIILTIVFLIYRYQLNRQKRKSEIINEINLSKLAAIQSQMNPHFIFNSLNSIQDLVLKGDIDNSYIFITKFSDLIRRTLNYSDKDFISFDQEIKLLDLYLSLEKLRYKKDLNFVLDASAVEEKEDLMLPPMLIQPFIENALVHGLLHKSGEKWLKIDFKLNDELICVIEDNGVGREKAREIRERKRAGHESFSGEAIKKRFAILKQQYGGDLGFEYHDLMQNGQPSGTKVTLRIPIRRNF